ncbi:MAG TPA: hypothetical protein VFP72_23220, partial [Kineosporiaceae bacterium]|nr:hypothetical protein [Kineosporiaceae bacterium]
MTRDDAAASPAAGGTAGRDRRDPWREALVLQLRLARVRGDRIGEVLAEVESHCAESGESPAEAFGDAEDYARKVVANRPPEDLVPEIRPHRLVGLALDVMIGIPTLLSAVDGLAHHRPAEFSVGQVVSLGCALVLSLAALGLPWLLGQRKAMLGGLLWLALMLVTAPVALWREPAVRLPALPVLVVGAVLVGTSLVTGVRR